MGGSDWVAYVRPEDGALRIAKMWSDVCFNPLAAELAVVTDPDAVAAFVEEHRKARTADYLEAQIGDSVDTFWRLAAEDDDLDAAYLFDPFLRGWLAEGNGIRIHILGLAPKRRPEGW